MEFLGERIRIINWHAKDTGQYSWGKGVMGHAHAKLI